MLILHLAIAARRHGWHALADTLCELELLLSGLGRASRLIRRDRKRRQSAPRVSTSMEGC